MQTPSGFTSNFAPLGQQDAQLLRLGMLAEGYFARDPNTSLLKCRQFAELLAQLLAAQVGLYTSSQETQYDLLARLQSQDVLPREVVPLFGEIRRAGNAANHALVDDHQSALSALKMAWQLGLWFHRTFADPDYRSGPFRPPPPPEDESQELHAELERLRQELEAHQAAHQSAQQRLQETRSQLQEVRDERAVWEQLALEAEQAGADLARRLAQQQTAALQQPREAIARMVSSARSAASGIQLDERETRKLVDAQLQQAGWEADSERLTHAKGARPARGRFLAIAEWPTPRGPADYVLFAGLTPLAVVEAKRAHIDVSTTVQQAKRYSRAFVLDTGLSSPGGPWSDGAGGACTLPFVFSTNGRPYLKQLATRSGIWFCDLRLPGNQARALDGWYSPEGLTELLQRDETKASEQLAQEPFHYGFGLRSYQQAAIESVESALARGQRSMLLAMATGTGKTKTCIALLYRLLKVRRFRRVLFLVDRSALGEQALNAFTDTRMENLQTFADIFGIKGMGDVAPDSDTAVQVATVQSMVQRVLTPGEGNAPPTVDAYDCIVVDECHRGYLLDRELSEVEQGFRGFEDYISKYRRVLEYFDAVKIGLTATPALHTTQIFGPPIHTYSYREAVIDGWLVDHDPPVQIHTELSTGGIVWQAGEEVQVYDAAQGQIALFNTPDEIKLEVEHFNRRVITESFNQVVCELLARELDPESRQKTLIFCATDAHADLVVMLLKRAFAAQYGSCDDDAVVKITGTVDRPLELIRRYKNERQPGVAVTVDLLTTGVDVPGICNLVFLRRVNSRILFDQMLGRATRLCEEIGKERFRIFDAVRLYEALQSLTAMQPVVADPTVSFAQLVRELTQVTDDTERALVRDQLLAKLQRKKRHLSADTLRDFETRAGMTPGDFLAQLKAMPLDQVAAWFTQRADLGEILDRSQGVTRAPLFVSGHEDRLREVSEGYGAGQRPQDYLSAFSAFLREQGDTLPALVTVLTRPRDLTRRQLRELALALDRAGFTEASLSSAWRATTSQEMAAGIIGYIRQAAAGDALVPYEIRVDRALRTILGSQEWTGPQRQWLQRIAAQTRANQLVDREALDDPDLIFKRDGGGFARLDRIFGGKLESVLGAFQDAVWQDA